MIRFGLSSPRTRLIHSGSIRLSIVVLLGTIAPPPCIGAAALCTWFCQKGQFVLSMPPTIPRPVSLTSACNPATVALITSPNPDLSPERSKNYPLGAIWDPLPRTSISVDYWKIKRSDEIRDQLLSRNIVLLDGAQGTTWQVK